MGDRESQWTKIERYWVIVMWGWIAAAFLLLVSLALRIVAIVTSS